MLCCNRFIKIIWLTLGIFLLTLNIIIWANNSSTMGILKYTTDFTHVNDYLQWKQSAPTFKGFKWFYDYISTFPGPLYTLASINRYANVMQNFNVTNIWGIDLVLAILRVISWPVIVIWTILVDIINNIIWFINAFAQDIS